MPEYYWDNNGLFGTDTTMFAPGSITGSFVDGQAFGSPMPQGLMGLTGQGNNGFLGGLFGGSGMNTLMGLGQLGLGFMNFGLQNQYMDMMKEQLGMARERWDMTKDELNRIRGVRDRLNSSYMGNA